MSRNGRSTRSSFPLPAGWSHRGLNWCCGLLLTVSVSLTPAQAGGPDEEYIRLYGLISAADELSQRGQSDAALVKYREAHTALQEFRRRQPTWSPKIVAYRLNYVAGRIADLSRPSPTPVTEPASPGKRATLPGAKGSLSLGDARVTLLEAGAMPGQQLRLRPTAGGRQRLEMSLNMTTGMEMGGAGAQTMRMPPINLTWEVTVKGLSAEGDVDYEMVVAEATVGDDPDAAPQLAEAINASLGAVKGLASSGTLSSRGLHRTAKTKPPADPPPAMRQALGQMQESVANLVVQLPEEAVGPGAKWEVSRPVQTQGMTIQQTTLYELVSLEDHRLTVKSTVRQKAASQKIQNPAMPGMTVDMTQMSGEGTATLTLDLGLLLPLSATARYTSEVTLGMEVGGRTQEMTLKAGMDVRAETQ